MSGQLRPDAPAPEDSTVPKSPADRFGLSVALTTPFAIDGSVDLPRLLAHGRACLDAGCDSLTLFGTTGEGASLGMGERARMLEALTGQGIDPGRIVAGIAAAAAEDAAAQARMALDAGCRGLLVAPPFYFRNVGDDGVFGWFAAWIEALAGGPRGVILYNIPQLTGVALSVPLIERLRRAFPGVVTGVKDSSGDWPYSEALLKAHGDLAILIGDERHLARGVRLGAQGAISGLANVVPQAIGRIVVTGEEDPRVGRLVEELLRFPVTPAVKALVAHHRRDPRWLAARPPLVGLDKTGAEHMARALDDIFAVQVA
jgi:4-hydroxy-tetrahydrodipicolinate synthase